MITFLIVHSILLFTGALFCLGWYTITRGRHEVLPNGRVVSHGKLFKAWSLYFNRKTTPVYIQYNDQFLKELLLMGMAADLRQEWRDTTVSVVDGSLFLNVKLSEALIDYLKLNYQIEIELDDRPGNGYTYYVFKKMDSYVFPEWLRDMLAACPTCFASFYGTIYFFVVVGSIGYETMFGWAKIPVMAFFFFWISYCFSLAVINTVVAKKLLS